jgi:8-oxo-dGTP diphosphatase
VRQLVKVNREISWLPKPGEGRLYITDELPSLDVCKTAFGLAFDGDRVLLTRLRTRDWDIPGGMIEHGESPARAAVREVWEETYAHVEVIQLIGIQELEIFGPKPEKYRFGYPLTVQVYYLCRIINLKPFVFNLESRARGFFSPDEAARIPTMVNHLEIYQEALRQARLLST